MYKSIEESPREITISKYYKHGAMWVLREGMGINHPENLYNWFRKTYPDLNPAYYGINNPREEEFKNMTREELIEEILTLRELTQYI